MKFKYVKEVEKPVRNYDGKWIKTGQITDLPKHLALKADLNPDYEPVIDAEPTKAKKEVTDGDQSRTSGPSLRVPGTQDSGSSPAD